MKLCRKWKIYYGIYRIQTTAASETQLAIKALQNQPYQRRASGLAKQPRIENL